MFKNEEICLIKLKSGAFRNTASRRPTIMACGNVEKRRHRTGKKPGSLGLFSCSCLCAERETLQEEEKKINKDPLHPHLDQRGSGEKNVGHVTVEDLGIINTSFSPLDEEPLTPRYSVARSFSSTPVRPRAWRKKRLKAPYSVAVQPQVELTTTPQVGREEEQEEEFELQFENDTDSTPGLLFTPIINLIPPTPSTLIDDNQFFNSNLEECMAHTSGDRSFGAGDKENYKETTNSVDADEAMVGRVLPCAEREQKHEALQEQRVEKRHGDKSELQLLWNAYQVAPLPVNPKKRGFNTGINLLSFTEHNLDSSPSTTVKKKSWSETGNDPNNRDGHCSDLLKTELHLLSTTTMTDTFTYQKRPLTRSCSFGDTTTRTPTFQTLTQTTDQCKEQKGLSRQRRITVASYIPHSVDQNGNFDEKDANRQVAKSLSELNTEEVCQWFTSVGLQKCQPFIREANLCGADITSVDANILDILRIITLEDKEKLLSAIYNELHPPNTVTQTLDSLLESLGTNHVETFPGTLASMTKSKSSPHVSCLSMNRRSLKLRNSSQTLAVPRNSQMMEITINASERIIHLRTPKETTVGKVMDSCVKMLGMTDDQSSFTLKEKQESPEELSLNRHIGTILTSAPENRQLELHLCKTDKQMASASRYSPEINGSRETSNINKNIQDNQRAKEERIRELNQQVDSLKNVILQVQELHHGLVAFCSEIKSMDTDENMDRLSSAELKQRLEMVHSQLNEKRQSLQILRDDINNFTAHKNKQLEVRLLEKMKLNCQVFKEEISIVHLSRQAARLQNALQENCIKEKAETKPSASGSLSQLVSPQSPAMLMVIQEERGPEGHYGFTCSYGETGGLVVDNVDDSHLCVDDRLVEVNGVSVIHSTLDELTDLLLRPPTAQIVVIRQLPPALLQQPMVSPTPMQTLYPKRDAVARETLLQRKVITI